ncbi:MAG TPA: DUF4118 domain-containing protein, partial [Burkholderiaceae bacterium]
MRAAAGPAGLGALGSAAVAFGLALAAAVLQWSVRPLVGPKIPFLFFLPAIVAAAALAGRGAGVFVTLVGFASALRWLLPAGGGWPDEFGDELSLLIYLALGLALAALGERLRASSERASDA